MVRFAWTEQVANISAALHALEEQVAQGDVATPGLADFKSALDDLRLRAWGLLMATSADDYKGFQERFRIRRGKEMCRSLEGDLRAGKLSSRHPELPELGAAARDLVTTVDETQRGV
jgi:hypothetical protein